MHVELIFPYFSQAGFDQMVEDLNSEDADHAAMKKQNKSHAGYRKYSNYQEQLLRQCPEFKGEFNLPANEKIKE